jgi:hypothetical protein
MKRFRSIAAGLTACLLSGCSSVYLHDAGLQTSTGKAHEALAGVTPLKPFDDQLANLEAFAAREDQGVADYWTAVRDTHFDGLLTAGDAGLRSEMKFYVDERLAVLLGSRSVDPVMRRSDRRQGESRPKGGIGATPVSRRTCGLASGRL